MITNSTVNKLFTTQKTTKKINLNVVNELNPSDDTINFLLAYSKSLSVQKSKIIGDIFEVKN